MGAYELSLLTLIGINVRRALPNRFVFRADLRFLTAVKVDGGLAPRRFRVEHAQIIALEDIPRFAELGVIASMQPVHATSDMNMAEDRIGPDRIKGGYAWRRLLDSGAVIAERRASPRMRRSYDSFSKASSLRVLDVPFGLPSLIPPALSLAKASFVLDEINSRSI